MRRFLNYPGYRNVFSCIKCKLSDVDKGGRICERCSAFSCKHLIEKGDNKLCFCCSDDLPEESWPDWCFTMVPHELFCGRNNE